MKTASGSKARPAKTEQGPSPHPQKERAAPSDTRPAEPPWTRSMEIGEPDLPVDGDEPAEIEEDLPEY